MKWEPIDEESEGPGEVQLKNSAGWVLWKYDGPLAEHGVEWLLHRNVNAKCCAMFCRLSLAKAKLAAEAYIRAASKWVK